MTEKNEYKELMLKLKEDMQNDVVSIYDQKRKISFYNLSGIDSQKIRLGQTKF